MMAIQSSSNVICAVTDVEMHTVVYNWDIKNFDRICQSDTSFFNPVPSTTFKAGIDLAVESEWQLMLGCDKGFIQLWLQMTHNSSNLIQEIAVRLKVMILDADRVTIFNRRSDKPQLYRSDEDAWGMSSLIQLQTLWNNQEYYLANKTFRLRVQIEVIGDAVTSTKCVYLTDENSNYMENQIWNSDMDGMKSNGVDSTRLLKNDMKRLLERHIDTDVDIECDGEKFQAHKAILRARSNVFGAMLKYDSIENRSNLIQINDMNASTISAMLHYMYTGEIKCCKRTSDNTDLLLNLIAAGDKYNLDDLKNRCFYRLCDSITNQTIGKLAIFAYMHNANVEVQRGIRTYCKNNWSTLIKIQAFNECLIASPRSFFDDIRTDNQNDTE